MSAYPVQKLRNFKNSPFNLERPDRNEANRNLNAVKEWARDVHDAQLTWVSLSNQDKTLAKGEQHRLLTAHSRTAEDFVGRFRGSTKRRGGIQGCPFEKGKKIIRFLFLGITKRIRCRRFLFVRISRVGIKHTIATSGTVSDRVSSNL